MTQPLFPLIAVVVSAVAAVTDWFRGRIPNTLTLPALTAGLVLHAVSGKVGALGAGVGLVLTLCVPWALHRATRGQAIGGGDVKLFAALGALLGPLIGLEVELSSFVLLGLVAMVRLAFVGRLAPVLVNAGFLLANPLLPVRFRRDVEPEALTEMRLGPAIFVALLGVTLRDQLGHRIPWL